MDDQIYEILNSYKMALDDIINRLEFLEKMTSEKENELRTKIDELSSTVFDEILNPAKDAMERAEKESAFNEWNEKYGEKFAPYSDMVKAVEGDDFDLNREIYNNYNEIEEDKRPEMDVYVDAAVEKVANEIKAIKEKLGADNIEVKVDENGEAKIKIDGDEEKIEKTIEGEENLEDSEIIDEVEDNEDELKAFEEELEKQLPKK